MSEYDAFNGLSDSREDARKELLKKANEAFLAKKEKEKAVRSERKSKVLRFFLILFILCSLFYLIKNYI